MGGALEVILGLFRYRSCALNERAMLQAHARHAVGISSRPVYVLRELVDEALGAAGVDTEALKHLEQHIAIVET